MPLRAYLPSGFDHLHESQCFDSLVQALEKACSISPEIRYLIGNPSIDGKGIDALFLKPGAITVIEMKDYGGLIHFSENGEWLADDVTVKASDGGNPFRQVRGYKFSVMDYLQQRQNRILKSARFINWAHVTGLVLFGRNILFNEKLPPSISPWFHICDIRTVAKRLCQIHSVALQLAPEELPEVLKCLEVGEAARYGGSAANTAVVARPAPAALPLRLVIYKDSPFRARWQEVLHAGGLMSQGAARAATLLDQIGRGIDALAPIPSSAPDGVPNAFVYPLTPACHLLVFRLQNVICPWIIAGPQEIAQWIAANAGFTLAYDANTRRISPIVVGKAPLEENLAAAAPTTERQPLFSRLPALDLEQLGLKSALRKLLLALTEESTEQETMEVLDLVESNDVRSFLFDILNHLRSNDLAAAELRMRLRNGEALPAEDAPQIVTAAIDSGENSDQIMVPADREELERALDPDHFQDWMLWLHKDQREIAEAHFDKPAVLTGVSGSGKTCILVHRALHLARKYLGERIGIMTLNRALADLLRNLVDQLIPQPERAQIEVVAFYDFFRNLLHDLGPQAYLRQIEQLAPDSMYLPDVIRNVNPKKLANDVDVLSGETSENTWDDFFDQGNQGIRDWLQDAVRHLEEYRIDASRYLRDECTLVRSALTLSERDSYLDGEKFPREGRAIPFQPHMRSDLKQIILLFEEWMLAGGVLDVVELTQAVTPLWAEIRRLPAERRFRCLLIDEFQDFSTLDLRLLLHVPTASADGLFLAGDTVQKILVKRLRLPDAALGKGSVIHRQITRNYRNSRQILKAASTMANHYCRVAVSQGEEIEILDPELALRITPPPFAVKTDNAIRKAWEIALEWLQQGARSGWTICIATAAPDVITVDSILELKPRGVAAKRLSGDFIKEPETLVVSSVQDVKGFEFRLVLIVGCEDGMLPSPTIPPEESWREALRLYVAMTRARDQLYFFYETTPSQFLEVMRSDLIWKEKSVIAEYEVEPPPEPLLAAPDIALPRPVETLLTAKSALEPDEYCESRFNERERDLLHKYFARYIHEKPNAPDCFREWLKPRYLREIVFAQLAMIGRKDKAAFQSLRHKFIQFDIL